MKKVSEYFKGSLPKNAVIKDTGDEDGFFVIKNGQLSRIGGIEDSYDCSTSEDAQDAFDSLVGDRDLTRYEVLDNDEARAMIMKMFNLKDTPNAKKKTSNKSGTAATSNKRTRNK